MDAVHTNVIKRNGEEVNFDLDKIVNAINAANKEVDRLHQLNDYQVQAIADNIARQIEIMTHAIHVEDIQDMVETGIMDTRLPRSMCVTGISGNLPENQIRPITESWL